MELRVVKSGAVMFDALHACGLGVLVATAADAEVKLVDQGLTYKLRCSGRVPAAGLGLLDSVLRLPGSEETQDWAQPSIEVSNLDGLLAALFTTPGIRVVSAADLLLKQRFRPEAFADGLKKLNRALARWRKYASKVSKDSSQGWLWGVLQDYDAACPVVPLAARKRTRGDLSALMTLDPAFSYSTRRPISDGLVGQRSNCALTNARWAVLLALVGGARFLRAQRVAGKLVNLYVPLPASAKICSETVLPLLHSAKHPSDQAIALNWLRLWRASRSSRMTWSGLAYQVMPVSYTHLTLPTN